MISSRPRSGRVCTSCTFVRHLSSLENRTDYYQILGVDRSATIKEIKSAFYDLSKKHHPDRQTDPERKQLSTEIFRKIALAYEILGSAKKRRQYDDSELLHTNQQTAHQNHPFDQRKMRVREYTDLDIDYKTFELYQRTARIRRQNNEKYSDLPKEFYSFFGERKFSSTYLDSRAAQRLKEERIIAKEMEELRKKQRFKAPTFAELSRLQNEKKREERRTDMTVAAIVATVCTLIFVVKCLAPPSTR